MADAWGGQFRGDPSEQPAGIGNVGGTGGLKAEYYNTVDLTGAVVLSRTEAVNFNWGGNAPAAGVNADNFSVRWSGFLTANAPGSYTFQTYSDDGVRLWVNGVLVIDNWTDHAPTANNSAAITLAAGQRISVRMEYYERGGGATAKLGWRTPGSSSFVTVPGSSLSPN